jgi:hypothetical protein
VLVSVPNQDSEIFNQYFKISWHMEIGENFSYWLERKNDLVEVLKACGYNEMCDFQMLCMSHDIIYDRG